MVKVYLSEKGRASQKFEVYPVTGDFLKTITTPIKDLKVLYWCRYLVEWSKEYPYVQSLRELNRQLNGNYEIFRKGIENENPEICTNVIKEILIGKVNKAGIAAIVFFSFAFFLIFSTLIACGLS